MKSILPLTIALGSAALLTAQVATKSAKKKQAVVPVAEVKWGALNPARGDKGPRAANLWGDRTGTGACGFLVKFVDGFSSPPHIHNVTYRGVVISGLLHNDDPDAEPMWMPPSSFWTQPAGEVHITASKGESLAYIEIEKGPYLVLSKDEAFDKGERPVNVDASNIVWQDSSNTSWIANSATGAEIAFLWGKPQGDQLSGTLVKLPANFSGKLRSGGANLHAIVIKGQPLHKSPTKADAKPMQPGSYFGSDGEAEHEIASGKEGECLIYIRSSGDFEILGADPVK